MSTEPVLTFEIQKSQDELGNNVTTIRYHGRLVNDTAGKVKDLIKPLIGEGGRIVIDLGELSYLDSSGLGALVGLKVSALNKGLCSLDLVNLTPRVKELLNLANLTKLFAS